MPIDPDGGGVSQVTSLSRAYGTDRPAKVGPASGLDLNKRHRVAELDDQVYVAMPDPEPAGHNPPPTTRHPTLG